MYRLQPRLVVALMLLLATPILVGCANPLMKQNEPGDISSLRNLSRTLDGPGPPLGWSSQARQIERSVGIK